MFDIVAFLKKHENLQEVTDDKIYLDNQKTKYSPQGLMSEQIFGPVKSYSCSCGKLSVKILAGKRCPQCGVLCANNDLRYKQFARIRIPLPIMNSLNKKYLQQITTKYNKNILSPVQFDLSSTSKMFLQYDKSTDKLKLINSFNEKTCIPILITGNFSFYVAIYVINKLFNSAAAEQYLTNFFFDLLVLPPGARQPFVKDTNQTKKEVINSNLDELYIPILRHKKYKETANLDFIAKLTEYSSMVISSIVNSNPVPIEDQELLLFDRMASSSQYYCDMLYEELLSNISGKSGLVRLINLVASISNNRMNNFANSVNL